MNRVYLLPALILGLFILEAGDDTQAAQTPNKPTNIINKVIDYELPVSETVKVRLKDLQVEFDDKGRPVKLTPEELKKRKGDDAAEQKLPGYKVNFSVLKPGDIVQVSMSKPKDKEKTSWTAAGQYLGILLDVDQEKLTVRVDPAGPPPAGSIPGNKGGKPDKKGGKTVAKEGGPPKVAVDAEQRQATTILIVEQAPDKEGKRGKEKKKKDK